MYLFYFY